MSEKATKQLIEEINNYWLTKLVKDKPRYNPLDILKTDDKDEFQKKLAWLLMNPDYFAFLCRVVFNIDLLPMQVVILQELWMRKFPMLIGCRGLGKLLPPDEKIRIPGGWTTMEKIQPGDKVYGSNGKVANVVFKTELQKNVDMYRLFLRDGREVDCCGDHQWKVYDEYKNHNGGVPRYSVVKTADIHSYFMSKKDRDLCNRFAIPLSDPIEETHKEFLIHPYIAGVLCSSEVAGNTDVRFYHLDEKKLERLIRLLPKGYKWGKSIPYNYKTIKHEEGMMPFLDLCRQEGFFLNKGQSIVPEQYMYGSTEQKIELIRGVLDIDGKIKRKVELELPTERHQARFAEIVRSAGIYCDTNDKRRMKITTHKLLFTNRWKLMQQPVKRKEYSYIKNILKVENGEGYCITVDSPDNTYIIRDYIVTHNTFLLSLYSMMRALLMPNRRVVVAGAAFRQSRFLHEYMETIWKNAPVLRDICDSDSGCFRGVDLCKVVLNGSTISAIPIGDGCCRGDSLVMYGDSFGTIVDKNNKVWGNSQFRDIDYHIDNGVKPTKIVTTKNGYLYEATHNHAMKVLRNERIDWVRTDEMRIGDRILIDRSVRWHEGNFNCNKDEAYALGAMIGDGCWTNKYTLGFATKDQEIIDRIIIGLTNICDKQFVQKLCDPVHWCLNSKGSVSSFLEFWKLQIGCRTINKVLPGTILSANRENMTACLQGLFDTDGHVFTSEAKGGISASVHFTNTSETLVRQIQFILLHYGIVCKVTSRQRKNWNRVYELGIYGENVHTFANSIGFSLNRKQDKLISAILSKKRIQTFGDGIPINLDDVIEAGIKSGYQISKIKQLKTYQFSFLDKIKNNFNKNIQKLIDRNFYYDEVISIEDSECHTYDIHVPDGNEYCSNGFFSHNSKIRGLRGNDIIADEFASHSRDIFENVVAGFGTVTSNPTENVKREAAMERAIELGMDLTRFDRKNTNFISNQIVISGTAYYDFNHFAEYYKKWKRIILSKGELSKLKEIFGEEGTPPDFDWRDYSIIQIPYELIPKGFMDAGNIARSKATVHSGIFQMEYGATFSSDSQGFFKRSLIESCTGTDLKPVLLPSGKVYFDAMLHGKTKKYIMGVDPASEVDNFAITIVELDGDHRRVVYCWTTTRNDHIERVKLGLADENNFYSYCARKIRELMKSFNIIHISLDSQGGGYSISEALHDTNQLRDGEVPIWPVIDPEKEQETDDQVGLHILELVNFAKAEWTSDANHGMRKDLEDKVLLFPRFDPVTLGLSNESDKANNRLYDTLEDCVLEIEELKNELSIIEISQTPNGRDKWDTPETKIGVGKKKRLRKDRYSSLLMANMAARLYREPTEDVYQPYGGFAASSKKAKAEYIGPLWFTQGMKDIY